MAPKRQAQAICKLNDNNANGRNPTIGFLPCFGYRLIIEHLPITSKKFRVHNFHHIPTLGYLPPFHVYFAKLFFACMI